MAALLAAGLGAACTSARSLDPIETDAGIGLDVAIDDGRGDVPGDDVSPRDGSGVVDLPSAPPDVDNQTDADGAVPVACTAGNHNCGGTCVSNSALATCGMKCTPCSVPTGGTAVCDGTSCGGTCQAGFHLCAGACVADTSPLTCGTSCTACAAPSMATATCDGKACGFSCPTGTHACGNACVSNSALTSCGTSCTTCPIPTGGSATCDGSSCGGSCPTGTKLCAGACIAQGAACMGTCAAGTHDCSGTCQPDNNARSCGASCVPCAAPENATATCNGTACGFSCGAGYHLCGTACVSNTSPSSCGTSCTTCGAPANGSASCNGTTCDFTCGTGFHRCGSACASNTSVNSCGALCAACPTAAGGAASCVGGTCDVTCNAGYVTCNSGTAKSCKSKTYTFESGTTEGWALASGPPGAAVVNSNARSHGGTRALALTYSVDGTRISRASMHLALCTDAVTNLAGSSLSVWVYIDSATPLPGGSDASIYLYTSLASFYPAVAAGADPPLRTWIQVVVPISATDPKGQSSIGTDLEFYANATTPWSGTIYYDDFTITP